MNAQYNTQKILHLGLGQVGLEDTTKVCKEMTRTLSCQTLISPLVFIYDLVRDSLKPADGKGGWGENNMPGSWMDRENGLLPNYSAPPEILPVGRAPKRHT